MNANKTFTVKEINNYIKYIMDNDILLSQVSIKGEISNYKLHSSGHAYLTLKDSDSRIKCVMFKSHCSKLKFRPEDGLAVIVRGYISVYDRDGQYQLYAEDMVPDGAGALYLAYEQLKRKLSEEGFFDEENKKQIPFLPQRIGVVTSATGAAVRDIISIIRRRCPIADIILYPVQVQGEIAASEIAQGIRFFNTENNVDVIITGRGGGSIEELWAFNEEEVARAIFESHLPVISAVGHETDFTIADFVADIRAATPSAAAELVVPEMQTLINKINQFTYQLNTSVNMLISEKKMQIEYLSRDNTFRNIEQKLANLNQTIDLLTRDMENNMLRLIKDNKNILIKSIEKLDILNPAAAILRGYAIVKDLSNNKVISTAGSLNIGEKIRIELRDGNVTAEIKEKTLNNNISEV